jgi:hypothetical protein
VVLAQNGRPLAYMSKTIGPIETRWSIYSKGMLAIMEAIWMWQPYLLDQKFQIWTDQKGLKFFLEHQVVTLEQKKCVSKLLGSRMISFIEGRTKLVANTLSRQPTSLAKPDW